MREKTVEIGGNKYRLAAVGADLFFDLHNEFKASAECPVDKVLKLAERLPESHREAFIGGRIDGAIAKLEARESITCPEFQEWLATGKGAAKVFGKMFKKHHPELTEDQAFALACEGVAEHGEAVFADLFPGKLAVPAKRRKD